MFGIIVFGAVLVVLGFVLAWIIGVVAHEEVDIKPAMGIVFLNGILAFIGSALISVFGLPPLVHFTLVSVVSLACLTGLLRALAHIPFSKGIVIAAVFAGITAGTQWGLASCMQSAAQNYTPPPR